MNDLVFGYRTAPPLEESLKNRTSSFELYRDGTFIYRSFRHPDTEESRVQFQVSAGGVERICRIISENRSLLRSAEKSLNANLPLDYENIFMFGDIRIVDWNKIRSEFDELYEKNPDELRRPARAMLEENYVMQVFTGICRILQSEDLQWNRMKYFL